MLHQVSSILAILSGGDGILLIHVPSSVWLQMCCKEIQGFCYNSDCSVVFKQDISKILLSVHWLRLIHSYFSQPPRLPPVQNSFKRFIEPVLNKNKQHSRSMVERFLCMIYVQVLFEFVFLMDLSSEHMMEVSKSLLLCNISAVQVLCSLASSDAIIPIRFMCLCVVLNCITCINKNKHTVYGSRSMSDEGRTTVTVTYSIGHSTFQADWEKPEKCRTHGCMLHASISSSNTSINFSNVPFRKLWIEDP